MRLIERILLNANILDQTLEYALSNLDETQASAYLKNFPGDSNVKASTESLMGNGGLSDPMQRGQDPGSRHVPPCEGQLLGELSGAGRTKPE